MSVCTLTVSYSMNVIVYELVIDNGLSNLDRAGIVAKERGVLAREAWLNYGYCTKDGVMQHPRIVKGAARVEGGACR